MTRLRTLWIVVALAVAGVLAAGCASSGELPAAVVEGLSGNNPIADLTTDDGSEDIRRDVLLPALARAEAAGTRLRVVVTGENDELVSAKTIVDTYGGTALSYQANRTGFEAASRDMSASQLERAIDQARVQLDIGDSAAAFVDVIETEGLDAPGSGLLSKLIVPLLIAAAAFMLWGAWSYLQARKRRAKRMAAFMERRGVLADWAAQLGPEVESLRAAVAASPDSGAQATWHQAQEFVSTIGSTVEGARTISELDAAEMRISRTAIKLRDLRRLVETAS